MIATFEILASLVALVVVVVLSFMRRTSLPPEGFIASRSKPILWWFVDTEPNSRSWLDFGGRKTMEPNRGYLQLALGALQRTQIDDFEIRPLIGRAAVLAQIPMALPRAAELPPALWRRYAVAGLLEANGGLVMDGNSTLCVGPSLAPFVFGIDAAVFDNGQEPGPSPFVGWASSPNHPAWVYAASTWRALVERGPQAWNSAELQCTTQGLNVISGVESGTPVLEDLFGRIADPKVLPSGTAFISYDGDDLARRYEFNWFLRLSSQQILASDFVWAQLARSINICVI